MEAMSRVAANAKDEGRATGVPTHRVHVPHRGCLDAERDLVFERERSAIQRVTSRHSGRLGQGAQRAIAGAREQGSHYAERDADIAAIRRVLAHRFRARARAGDRRDHASWSATEARSACGECDQWRPTPNAVDRVAKYWLTRGFNRRLSRDESPLRARCTPPTQTRP